MSSWNWIDMVVSRCLVRRINPRQRMQILFLRTTVRLSNAYSPFNGNPGSFGHGGIGGAVAFADPEAEIGFGFVTNRLVPGPGVSPYAQRLIDALSASL